MEYKGRYWKRRIDSEERQGPIGFSIIVSPDEIDPDKKAIEKAKLHVMCDLECTTTATIIEDPQILISGQWIGLG